MAHGKVKKAKDVDGAKRSRLLAPEQFRYCSILVSAGAPLEAQRISDVYAKRRGEPVNYTKTYNQLINLDKLGVIEKILSRKAVPPHNAMREVSLWQLTPLGQQLYIDTEKALRSLVENSPDSDR